MAPDDVASDSRRLVGSVQDVTLARRLDRQLAAHVAVTQALDEWTSLESGAKGLIVGLAHALELPFATFWVPDGPSLVARVIWHEPSHGLRLAVLLKPHGVRTAPNRPTTGVTLPAWAPITGSATVLPVVGHATMSTVCDG